MVNNLASKVDVQESTEFNDVWIRIFTHKGSTPILVVSDGKLKSKADIGQQVLDAFTFTIESPIFNEAKEKERT